MRGSYLAVKGSDGKTLDWKVEAGSPGRMKARGLEAESFRLGAEVVIGGFSSRDGSQSLAGWVVSFPRAGEGRAGVVVRARPLDDLSWSGDARDAATRGRGRAS